MLRIFKQNDISSAFGLVIMTILLKLKFILHPPALADLGSFQRGFLFSFPALAELYHQRPALYVIVSVLVLLSFAIYLNIVVNREKLLVKKTYLPAFCFILLSSFSPLLNIISMAGIANIILFIAFSKTLQLYHLSKPRRACFDIGLLVTIAGFFYFPALLFILLFLIILLLLRAFVIEEVLAYLLGILTPVYLCLSIVYLTGYWPHLHEIAFLHLTPPIRTMSIIPLILTSVISITMLVYSLFLLNLAGIKNTMAVRKKWNGVVIYLFFAMLCGIFSAMFPGIPWVITITPISILLCQTFLNNNEKYNTFTFYFLLVAALIIQWLL